MSDSRPADDVTSGSREGPAGQGSKYGGLQPRKPLVNSTQQFFDSADWNMRAGSRTGGTPQLRPVYATAKEGGSPRKSVVRQKSNLGRGEPAVSTSGQPGDGISVVVESTQGPNAAMYREA